MPLLVDLGPSRQQGMGHLREALLARYVQGGHTIIIHLQVKLGPRRQQCADHPHVAVLAGYVQG